METKNKILSIFAVITLITSILFVAISMNPPFVEANEKDTLEFTITPDGRSFELGVNQSKAFVAYVINGTFPYEFQWTLTAEGNFNILINEEHYSLIDGQKLIITSQAIEFLYPEATTGKISMTLKVSDSMGATGQTFFPITVGDPYTSEDYYINSMATAKYIVQTDDLGWYQVAKGKDGSIVSAWTSNDPTVTIEYAMSEGGLVYVSDGDYTGAAIDVPAGVTLIADPSTTGITYTSIGAGARIDEPNFNAAFGGYQGGSYSVVTNQTSTATPATWYLAFKPDSSIYFTSTDADVPITGAISNNTPKTVIVKAGDYTVNNNGVLYIGSNTELIFEKGAVWHRANNSPLPYGMLRSSNYINYSYAMANEGGNITIRGGTFDGNYANQAGGDTGGGIGFMNVTNVLVENCFIYNTTYDMLGVRAGRDVTFRHNTCINNTAKNGIFVENYELYDNAATTGSYGCKVYGNRIENTIDTGLYFTSPGDGLQVYANNITNTRYGIDIYTWASTVSTFLTNSHFYHNNLDQCSVAGFYISNVTQCVFSGNSIQNTVQPFWVSANATQNIYSDNSIDFSIVRFIGYSDSPYTYRNLDWQSEKVLLQNTDTNTITKIEYSNDGSTYFDTHFTQGIVTLDPLQYLKVTYTGFNITLYSNFENITTAATFYPEMSGINVGASLAITQSSTYEYDGKYSAKLSGSCTTAVAGYTYKYNSGQYQVDSNITAYCYIPSLTPISSTAGHLSLISGAANSAHTNGIVTGGLKSNGTAVYFFLSYRNESAHNYIYATDTTIPTNEWFCLTIAHHGASGTGYDTLYLNNAEILTATSIDNDDRGEIYYVRAFGDQIQLTNIEAYVDVLATSGGHVSTSSSNMLNKMP